MEDDSDDDPDLGSGCGEKGSGGLGHLPEADMKAWCATSSAKNVSGLSLKRRRA